MVEERVGDKLRRIRLAKGLSQRQLAKVSGIDREYICQLEANKTKSITLRTAEALAKGLAVDPGMFFAGERKETTEDILDRLRLATPQSIPVYPWEAFPFHAGDGVEPVEYVYRARPKITSKNIEAYVMHGDCLEPKLNDGDVIVIDRDKAIDNGDIVACIVDNKFHVLKVRKVADELWLENNHGKFKYEQCTHAAPVIECIRRFK